MPRFCRHGRFVERCPICSQEDPALAAAAAPPRRSSSGGRTARRAPSARGVRVRHADRPVADGYANGLVPGLRATPDARRLADELAFSAGRLAELEADPPGLYAEVAASPDAEEALWLAFLIAYLSPVEGAGPWVGIREARTSWGSGALPALDGVPTGPRTAHAPERGTRTLEAYRAWAARAGSQLAGLHGEPSWTPERRHDRAFERLALPGFHRGARIDFLTIAGRLGIVDLRPSSLHLGGSDVTSVAAKRVFGIGEPMLLARRAAALVEACEVPLEALDLALYNWGGEERATLGATETAADRTDRAAIDAALVLT
jgi:hypothetical protein